MSALSQPVGATALVLDPALLARARAQSAKSQRALVDEIEAETGFEPRLIVRALAAPFGLAVLETADMLAFTPAFDLLPLSQALARHCVLLRSPSKELIGVVADPFDLDLQTWLGARAQATPHKMLHTRLALASDIQAYLGKHEESARAVDSLVPGVLDAKRDGKATAVLSFA
ncbi:MAG: type secretion system family protein, partial [Massilia sp.]|nr:type secretion system family protein [Massilia sp.]